MEINKAITYSLLSHIRNSGTLIKGPLDIFVPLVKRTLYFLFKDGITKGQSIFEIQAKFLILFSIDIPLPVLANILTKISEEYNTTEVKNFQLFRDKAFAINQYIFDDFEESVQKSKVEAEQLKKIFNDYCTIKNIPIKDQDSIFTFIDKNKLSLSKYLCNTNNPNNELDFTAEAQFVSYFRNIPSAYELIRKIYLGSIISSYLEYKIDIVIRSTELLLDTNFIISLIDLNTIEATHTCNKLVEIAPKQGYRFTVLKDTIEETQNLLKYRAENLNNVFLQAKINPEDIYNACERRNINRSDLERISDNLEINLTGLNIITIHHTQKYANLAKYSSEYKVLQQVRNTNKAALHDATAIQYVREKRSNKKIKDFEKVPCWFVNNSTTPDGKSYNPSSNNDQPEMIRADQLLNIIWLSNPSITQDLSNNDIADIGISSLVAFTLNETLPKSSIIRELDDNIQKYAKERVSDDDVILISTRIVNRQLSDIQRLNDLTRKEDKSDFVNRLKAEAAKQRKTEEEQKIKLEALLSQLRKSVENAYLAKEIKGNEKNEIKIQKDLFQQQRDEKILSLEQQLQEERNRSKKVENNTLEEKREEYIKTQLWSWRRKSWVWLGVFVFIVTISLLYLLYSSQWNFNIAAESFKNLQGNIIILSLLTLASVVFSVVIVRTLSDKYNNESNIKAFKEQLKMPENLRKIE